MTEKNEPRPAEVKPEVKTEVKTEIKTEIKTEAFAPKQKIKTEIKTEPFLPRPEKIRKKEKPQESFVPVPQGPTMRGNPYGEWKSIQPK